MSDLNPYEAPHTSAPPAVERQSSEPFRVARFAIVGSVVGGFGAYCLGDPFFLSGITFLGAVLGLFVSTILLEFRRRRERANKRNEPPSDAEYDDNV